MTSLPIRKLKNVWERMFEKVLLNRHVQVKLRREFHGSQYGGWFVCPDSISKETIVYSFGLGEDITFDLSLIKAYGLSVYGFDPTPKSVTWVSAQETPIQFHFLDYGIANYDGTAKFYLPENPDYASYSMIASTKLDRYHIEFPVFRLRTIMDKLGHSVIDILKMDIEGVEYAVIEDLVKSGLKPQQVLVEFHHRFENVGLLRTVRAIQALNNYGYKIFSISSTGEEYSFKRS